MEELLVKLSNAHGISGSEGNIKAILEEELKPYADELRTDKMGNLVAIKKGEGPSIMLAAHMDEIGLMVKYIDDKGFISVTKAGGINPKLALGNRVRIYGTEMIKGVVAVKAEHKGGEKGEIKVEDLIIDTGAKSKDDIKDIEFCWIVDYLPYCDGMDIIHDFECNTKHRVWLLDSNS